MPTSLTRSAPTRRSSGSRKSASPAQVSRSRSPRFGISRIDSKATHGWFVRLGWHTTPRGKKARFVSFFPDLRLGGKRKALAAAQAWVRHVLRWGRPPRLR
jgi:hypothetical protein